MTRRLLVARTQHSRGRRIGPEVQHLARDLRRNAPAERPRGELDPFDVARVRICFGRARAAARELVEGVGDAARVIAAARSTLWEIHAALPGGDLRDVSWLDEESTLATLADLEVDRWDGVGLLRLRVRLQRLVDSAG